MIRSFSLTNLKDNFLVHFALLFGTIFFLVGKKPPFGNEYAYLLRLITTYNSDFLLNDATFAIHANEHWLFNHLFGLLTFFFSIEFIGWSGRIVCWAVLLFALMRLAKHWEIPLWMITASILLWLCRGQSIVGDEWIFGTFEDIEAGRIFEQQKIFEVVVWSPPEVRQNLSSVRDLLLETPSGAHVRLSEVAQVSIKPSRAMIRRESISNYLEVLADVRGRDLGSAVRETERRLSEIKFPLEYHAEVLGEYAEQQAARNRLLVIAMVALAGIFLLLQAAFRSWSLAGAVFLALPLALVGGLLAASLGGGVVSIGTLAGLLAVLGITVRQAITLIHHYRHLEAHEGQTFGSELVQRGTREKLTAIMATAVATALSFLPIALLGDIPGLELLGPMATTTIAGLVTSTLTVLVMVPVLYLQFGSSPESDLAEVGAA